MENIDKKQLLNDIKEYIKKVSERIEEVINTIRTNSDLNDLPDLLEGLTYCINGLNLMNIENVNISIEDLKENISEILDGMENQDFNLIADILEYEIIEKIEDLNEILKNS
ncbi:hypothetical protein [uncultured Tyzzerella sp.]|uniref:hypothetical protein n=1 Tax=uncultured Tyzzerella sp. TaxID=2321398 RepID=UPI002942309E|nr:hypothetical protein [uncultured Tyzzerella sp.]